MLHRATSEPIASGAQERALKAGDVAPEFTLPDPDGTPVSSGALLARGPLVVTFYRGAWSRFCNFDLSALEEVRPDIEARGASLVAISEQTAPNSRKSQRQNGLGFPILGDHCGGVAAQFGVRWTLPDYLREVQKALGADLALFNGEDSWTLSMPARYVIAQDGTIAYAEVNADYTRRPEPSAILPVLERLAPARSPDSRPNAPACNLRRFGAEDEWAAGRIFPLRPEQTQRGDRGHAHREV